MFALSNNNVHGQSVNGNDDIQMIKQYLDDCFVVTNEHLPKNLQLHAIGVLTILEQVHMLLDWSTGKVF